MYGDIIMNDKELAILHAIAPLSKQSQQKIWKKLHAELKLGFVAKLKHTFKAWHTLILMAFFALFSSLSLNANTTMIISSHNTGWNAVLTQNKLSIEAVNPMAINENEVCVLWSKKQGEIFQIATLPNSGTKQVTLNQMLLEKLKDTTIIISIENKGDINKPSRIEYEEKI
jgi:hypothetical protein